MKTNLAIKSYGILSFKGTVKEFRLFLQGLVKDLDEGMGDTVPSVNQANKVS